MKAITNAVVDTPTAHPPLADSSKTQSMNLLSTTLYELPYNSIDPFSTPFATLIASISSCIVRSGKFLDAEKTGYLGVSSGKSAL